MIYYTQCLAVFILGEDFSLSKLLAVVCILAGNFIVLYKRGEHSIVLKGLWFSLASATFVGFAYFVDKSTFEHFPMALYAVAVYVIPAVVVGVIFKFTGGTKSELITEFKRTSWKIPALSFIGVFCFYLLLKTYEITPLSIAIPLIYSSTILTTLGGIFLLNEKSHILRKIVAALLVFIGLLLLK